jgi:hypothetical protein
MNVELRLPPEWNVAVAVEGTTRATSDQHPGVVITTAPMSVVVDRKTEWARAMMCQQLGVTPDKLALLVDEKAETVDAWPGWFVVAERRDPGEVAAFAFYYFLDYSSFATIRGPNAGAHLDLLRRARPNYASTDVIALEQLWE